MAVPPPARREPGQAAAACGDGVYIVDLEPHEPNPQRTFVNYFRDDLGAGAQDVAAYCSAFLARGGRELWLWPDARPHRIEQCAPTAWLAQRCVTRWYAQSYWTDFHQTPLQAIGIALQVLTALGVPQARIGITIPGAASAADAQLALARSSGLLVAPLWRRGTLTPALAAAIAAEPDSVVPPTPAPAPVAHAASSTASPSPDPQKVIDAAGALYMWAVAEARNRQHPSGPRVSFTPGFDVIEQAHDARGRTVLELHIPR